MEKRFLMLLAMPLFAGLASADCSLENVLCVAKSGGEYSTVQSAVNAAKPGDTVLIQAGDYGEEVTISIGGTQDNPIRIVAAERHMALLRCIDVKASNVIVEGLRFNACARTAITVSGSGNRIIDNYAYQPQMGIVVSGSNHLVEGNEVERLKNHGTMGDCDYSRFFGTGHVFRDNRFHGTVFSEIGDAHVDCFQTFTNNGEVARDMLFERNWCEDFHQGMMASNIKRTDTRNFTIRHNVFAHGGAWGLCIQDIGQIAAEHNTFYDIYWFGIGIKASSGNVIKNNIFMGDMKDKSLVFQNGATGIADYNLIFSAGAASPAGPNNIYSDPLFNDAGNDDFSLKPESPACNGGEAGTYMGAYPCGCVPNWQCSEWSACSNGRQDRTCEDSNQCDTAGPASSRDCSVDCVSGDVPPCDGCVTGNELSQHLGLWKRGDAGMKSLMEAIKRWKSGC